MLNISAGNIIDLEVKPDATAPNAVRAIKNEILPAIQPAISPIPTKAPSLSSQQPLPPESVDPAIVSFGKKPAAVNNLSPLSPKVGHPPIPPRLLVEAANGSPTRLTPTVPTKPVVPIVTKPKQVVIEPSAILKHDPLATATLSEPFGDLSIDVNINTEDTAGSEAAELGIHGGKGEQVQLSNIIPVAAGDPKSVGTRTRRRTKGRGSKNGLLTTAAAVSEQKADPDSLPLVTKREGVRSGNKSGMQGLPSVPPVAKVPRQPKKAQVKPNRRMKNSREERLKNKEGLNGWATEDATDIQEMGYFDFEKNLSKFDKREVFSQLRKDDTTADEARLVNYNRLALRAGTAGGKNLHWTENVLDSSPANGYNRWNSEAGESECDHSDDKISSEKSSRRNISRASLRAPSGKGSAKEGDFQLLGAPRALTFPLGGLRYSSYDQASSPRPRYTPTVRSPLRVVGSKRECPCLSPLQMLEFEQYTCSELGLNEDILTENAARGIAETAMKCLQGVEKHAGKRFPREAPIIVVVAADHKSGARAIASARHLGSRFRTSVAIMGLEREEDLLDAVRHQAEAYSKAGGKIYMPNELLEALKGGSLSPTILIDALLGIHTGFGDLRRTDQAFYFELLLWVSRNPIEVLSIDVPSGLDPSTGIFLIVPLPPFPPPSPRPSRRT